MKKNHIIFSLIFTLILIIPATFRGKVITSLDFYFINIGYGSATLIKLPNGKYFLIDGGYKKFSNKLLSYINELKIKEFEALINTHPHPDHIEGLIEVLKNYKVKKVYGSHPLNFKNLPEEFQKNFDEFALLIKNKKIPYQILRRGDVLKLDNTIEINVLHPEHLTDDLNDSSIVLEFKYFKRKVILPADIGPKAQKELFKIYGNRLKCDLLLIPHHGGFSNIDFIKTTNPEIAILSVGKNPYGNPVKKTIYWYKKYSKKLLRTDEAGDIVIKIIDDKLVLTN